MNNEQDNFMKEELLLSMTTEEKIAVQIGDLLSNLRIDLDSVGFYLSRSNPLEIYRRFECVSEAARKFKI